MKKHYVAIFSLILCLCANTLVHAQGTWTPVYAPAPDSNLGGMMLLSDGRVMCKTSAGGTDGYGNTWNVLTPDIHGSYANGTWSTIAQMHDTRLYYSSQMLRDGRIYMAGGEYGSGRANSEIYDPLADAWKLSPVSYDTFYDANSNMLPDGRVLQQLLMGNYLTNAIFEPTTSTYSPAGSCHGYPSEAAWLQLPDNSVLFNDLYTNNSERFIPKINTWVTDAVIPDTIWGYDETGGALLLPNGKGIFFGASGHTALYTPSGNTSPGHWVAGPDFPNGGGDADAPAAAMANGKVLCMAAPKPTSYTNVFLSPTSFYEYDYVTNTFSYIAPPFGLDTNTVNFVFTMIDLPDGTVMLSEQGSQEYFIYTPSGPQLASGKPSIDSIVEQSCGTYMITGELFNGLDQGATYNDDFQNYTNYPIVRLTSNGNVYYARSYNWNHTGVMTDSLEDTAYFTVPATLPAGTYWLTVSANGISSDSIPFTPCIPAAIHEIANTHALSIQPNPSNGKFIVRYDGTEPLTMQVYNVLGENIYQTNLNTGSNSIDISNSPAGVYMYRTCTKQGKLVESGKLVIQ
jgi:hypothetical protein